MKDMDYEQVEAGLRDLPMTWYPALLIAMVEAAYAKKAFIRQMPEPVYVTGGASVFVASVENRLKREGKL